LSEGKLQQTQDFPRIRLGKDEFLMFTVG